MSVVVVSLHCQSTSTPMFSVVTEDLLSVLSELQEAVRHWPEDGHPGQVSGCLDLYPSCFLHLCSN